MEQILFLVSVYLPHCVRSASISAGDLNAPETLLLALEGIDGLFLITFSDESNASLQTEPQVIDLAENAGVKQVVVLVGQDSIGVSRAMGGRISNFLSLWARILPIGHTVVPTVKQVNGRPARTLAEWVTEHKNEFL
ncbi:hypothetical protein [Paenibacillus spongiae]|uniref:Uncharacterized protein n=1 Tax=Paenibacillus spongiae TaxID=2909671 RepID=A0ABY5SIC8_9BACL|nr:hypothetical protein [Paenibacillus spongiae]UVI33215.1 hypothetical protein L1F29_15820 [Paenibacillus spongiae]